MKRKSGKGSGLWCLSLAATMGRQWTVEVIKGNQWRVQSERSIKLMAYLKSQCREFEKNWSDSSQIPVAEQALKLWQGLKLCKLWGEFLARVNKVNYSVNYKIFFSHVLLLDHMHFLQEGTKYSTTYQFSSESTKTPASLSSFLPNNNTGCLLSHLGIFCRWNWHLEGSLSSFKNWGVVVQSNMYIVWHLTEEHCSFKSISSSLSNSS